MTYFIFSSICHSSLKAPVRLRGGSGNPSRKARRNKKRKMRHNKQKANLRRDRFLQAKLIYVTEQIKFQNLKLSLCTSKLDKLEEEVLLDQSFRTHFKFKKFQILFFCLLWTTEKIIFKVK